MSQPLLEEILARLQGLSLARLQGLSNEQLAQLDRLVKRGLGSPLWMPTTGPQ